MSINSPNIRSKYFTGRIAMDESLSDFQERKQSCKGPKAPQKSGKPKTRKVSKRIKGQKDIRSALKGKNNELVKYSKEFESQCKKSGIDVDSEQLQLAIALSKSLQTGTDEASTSQSLSTQGRIAKIRTTLKEYGFKVPETKTVDNKRTKKFKKQYKLLQTTDEERHQKITSKYSQILFEVIDCSKFSENTNKSCGTPIFDIGTNLAYEYMRDNTIFYVNNLVDKSTTSGCLFKDWSEIPGRPISPRLFEEGRMNISEIVCSQEELDILLSGPLKSATDIIATKQQNKPQVIRICDVGKDDKYSEELPEFVSNTDKFTTMDETNETTLKNPYKDPDTTDKALEIIDIETNDTLPVRDQYRSCSPDIFDDEISCIMETSKPVLSQGLKTKLFTEETNYMDLTECAYIVLSQNQQAENVTKRKSNDFMEITKCAVSSSQGIREDLKNIDLTQSSNKDIENNLFGNDTAEINNDKVCFLESEECCPQDNIDLTGNIQKYTENEPAIIEKNNAVEKVNSFEIKKSEEFLKYNIDLTQSFDDDKTLNDIGKDKSVVHENIDLIEKTLDENIRKDEINDSVDLTQSSKSSIDIDDLPEVNFLKTKETNIDDTIIIDKDEYVTQIKKSTIQDFTKNCSQKLDLEVPIDAFKEQSNDEGTIKLSNQSLFEDFVHEHSVSNEDNENFESGEIVVHTKSKESNNIDLTQSSNESREYNSYKNVGENVPRNSSLGKRDEVSIDYDEVCAVSDEGNCEDFNFTKTGSCDIEIVNNKNDMVSNSSKTSEVFDLTDKELDYSLHKSRHEVDNYYDFGGISSLDEASDANVKKSLEQNFDDNDTYEYLPEVNVKKTEEKQIIVATSSTNADTDYVGQTSSKRFPIVTPKHNDYIIKTDDVTPKLDYASMTTPQRNRELDKYGLKPFKRKRAIQILTHLYNQTHPVVEPYIDDNPSPSKKPRNDSTHQLHASPMKLVKPHENAKEINRKVDSPQKLRDQNKKSPRKGTTNPRSASNENIVCSYEVTCEMPMIRSVECDPDDWVFQKREKAKVHSCRVPLHIAFHNYVFSRRDLREAILKYEPVNIDVIHKDLVSYGHRYDPKDLLRFLDKKCITVKTVDNNARNKR